MTTAIFIVLLLCLIQLWRIRQYLYVSLKNDKVVAKQRQILNDKLIAEIKKGRS